MRGPGARRICKVVVGLALVVAALVPFGGGAQALAGGKELTRAERLTLGERMYRDGILPSGLPMPALIRKDVEVDSSAFSCSSCHLRAGLGSFEGGVVTPPTTGLKLYQPYHRPPSLNDVQDQAGRFVYAKTVQERPAYNRQSLESALRLGIDPAGQVFNDVMPRYPLAVPDMSLLIEYLESLSSTPSPGASKEMFRFATVITSEVSREDREALLAPLESFIENKNEQMALYKEFLRMNYTPTVEMKDAFRNASLAVWELKGAPETWEAQLAAYYQKEPVFALLGGISYGDWAPIHRFCEKVKLPCLFPITKFPVLEGNGWYTYYFDKGYYQEGEAVASYLNRSAEGLGKLPVVELVQDSAAGRALSRGFDQARADLGLPPAVRVVVFEGDFADPERLAALLVPQRPSVVVLWGDRRVLPALETLAGRLPSRGGIFVSSTLLGKEAALVPEKVRDRVYLSFPYRLTPYVGTRDYNYDAKVAILPSYRSFGAPRIASRTSAMLTQVVLRGLNLLYDDLYRDQLLDILAMQMDQTVLDYERFSFGPGQRFASKGCYIIQLGPGSEPALLARSEWVIH